MNDISNDFAFSGSTWISKRGDVYRNGGCKCPTGIIACVAMDGDTHLIHIFRVGALNGSPIELTKSNGERDEYLTFRPRNRDIMQEVGYR
jgi:hypothetical protein